jgi:hypothetical protein
MENEDLDYSPIYELLLSIKKGFNPGWYVSRYDDLLDHINFNEKNPGLSKVTITFDNDDDFFDLFELDDDDRYWIRRFEDSYWDADYGTYDVEEAWSEGWLYEYFLNNDNKNKLNTIVDITNKDLINKDWRQKSKYFYEHFPNESDWVYGEYATIEHECKLQSCREEVESELGNRFKYFGIREVSSMYKYVTSVNILIKLFQTINGSSEESTLKDLLHSIVNKYTKQNYGMYNESYYNTGCHNFDNEYFNSQITRYFDNILESLYDSEEYNDVEEYYSIIRFVANKYGFDKWINLQRNKNLYFRVKSVDPKTNKLLIEIVNNITNSTTKRSLTYDEFIRFESQYELFIENKKNIKKFLKLI